MRFQSIKRVISKCQESTELVSLLLICGKKFELLIDDKLLEFFIKSNLISSNKLGFKQGDSCIYQLLSIHTKFINRLKTINRGIFLGISKAFDKVWLKDLIFKLKQNRVTRDFLNVLLIF